MKKTFTISALVVAIGAASFNMPVQAGPDHHHHKHSHKTYHGGPFEQRKLNMRRMMAAFAKLELSEQQKTEIKSLIKQGFQAGAPKREEIRTLREQIRDLKQAEVIDEQSLRSTAISIANLRTDLMLANLQNRKKIEELLDDNQLEKLQAMKEKRKLRQASR